MRVDFSPRYTTCSPGSRRRLAWLLCQLIRRLIDCFASGWMRVRGRARQRGVELPLILSDHADWDELLLTVSEIAPRELWVTHGREEALVRWCETHGHPARALRLVGYEDDDLD